MLNTDFAFIKPFPKERKTQVEVLKMRSFRKREKYDAPHKHDGVVTFLCFLATALAGYFLTNYIAMLSA